MTSPVQYPFLDLQKADTELRPQLEEAALRVIRSGRYIGGPEVEALEQTLEERFGAARAVAVANGLDALRLALRACVIEGILRPGDEVIVPANTYIASVLAITDAGLTPRLVDPDPATMCLSGSGVEAALTDRVRAIMPVHLYGRTAWDERMHRIAAERDFIVIEDAAQSIGAKTSAHGLFGSQWTGAIGHIGALSFYPTKNIGALGDAGAVLTHLPSIADTIRALANYGSDRRYHNIYCGFNSRLDPIQAAMIGVKLGHLEQLTTRRRAIADTYSRLIDNPLVMLPDVPIEPEECVWHQYVIRTDCRDLLSNYLDSHGVQTDIHYPAAPHQQPCYSGLSHESLPLSERLAAQVLSLPITSGCTSVADAAEIASLINRFKP